MKKAKEAVEYEMPPFHVTVNPRTFLIQSVPMGSGQEAQKLVNGDLREATREADRLNPNGDRISLIYELSLVGVGFRELKTKETP